MLGILLGTEHGLLELIPGEQPHPSIAAGAITTIDVRDDLALVAGPEAGAWLHESAKWRQVWAAGADETPRVVRVGDDGALYVGVEPAMLYVSTDRGARWEAIEGVRGLVRHERTSRTPPGASAPYLSGVVFPGDGIVIGVAGAGAWSTRDGGTSWLRRAEGLDTLVRRMWEHPERGDRLYATTDSGFYRTDDGGFTWVQSLRGLDRSHTLDAAILPATPDHLLLSAARRANGEDGALFRSPNGGLSWQRAAFGDEDEFERAPLLTRVWDSADTLFALANGTVWGSHDAGRSWVPLAEGLPDTVHALAAAL